MRSPQGNSQKNSNPPRVYPTWETPLSFHFIFCYIIITVYIIIIIIIIVIIIIIAINDSVLLKRTLIRVLRGHACVLHDFVRVVWPLHVFPPFCGTVQLRLLVCTPPPHSTEHGFHGDHWVHLP